MKYRRMPLDFTSPEPGTGVETRSRAYENPSISLDDPRAWAAIFGWAGSTLTDEPLDRDVVFSIPAVKAAVNRISDAIASIPLNYYAEDPATGSRTLVPVTLHDRTPTILSQMVDAEAFLTSNRWRKRVMLDVLLDGRHVSLIRTNGRNGLHSIVPFQDIRNKMKFSLVNGVPTYTYQRTPNSAPEVYKASQVLDFVWMPDVDGISHVDPIASNADTFGLCRAAERFASKTFSNGGIVPYFIQYDGPTMSPDAMARAREDFKKAQKIATDSGSGPMLPAGFKVTTVGLDPAKLQLLDLKKFQITEIARVYGIPPIYLQDHSTGTFNNGEQQAIFFAVNTLVPFCQMIEDEINVKIAKQNNFAEFDVDGLLRGDAVSKTNAQRTQIYSGIKTINEIRREYNLPPVPGGDEARIQQATVPIQYAQDLLDSQGNVDSSTQDGQDPAAPGEGDQ